MHRFQKQDLYLYKKGKWEQFRDAVDEYATLQHAEEVLAASLMKAEAECSCPCMALQRKLVQRLN